MLKFLLSVLVIGVSQLCGQVTKDTLIVGKGFTIEQEYFANHQLFGQIWLTKIWVSQLNSEPGTYDYYIDTSYQPYQLCEIYSYQPIVHVLKRVHLKCDFNYLFQMRLDNERYLGRMNPFNSVKAKWACYGGLVVIVVGVVYCLTL